ncbi:undecaprenyl-diphosphate phosphatase [Melghirimyces algeriensis]|uniref:Undecaprenyl-diphosphatase n=1 Tax=Melghirimyces algeriensis TaxID=910412 RepID=A0A521D493_9BACL|nr:undecaprenyl-diphosphate phosphatase [Melghirimyces algeriensis]SMO65700.1 Undecaprenyl-diphosphatase [Melghirimyces algeriensis]
MTDIGLLLKYALLGLLQGITEPIPVSSSGHLLIASELFGLEIEGLSFAVFMNFASLLAVLIIYRKDLIRLTVNGFRYITTGERQAKDDFMFIVYLIIGTIPAGVAGVLFEDYIKEALEGILIIGVTLIITGIALWVIRNLRGRKNDQNLSLKDAIIVGLAQAVALIPGISRSGATIVASMGIGMKRDTALRYSFLLYIPVSVGGMILSITDLMNDPKIDTLLVPYLIAFVLSFIASYFSLKWLMNIMAKGNLGYFTVYCVAVGLAVIGYSLF